MSDAIYKYIGDGSALPGLPARDVTISEINASGYTVQQVLGSGLYQPAAVISKKEN